MGPFPAYASLAAGLLLAGASARVAAEAPTDAARFRHLVTRTARATNQLEFTQMLTAILRGPLPGPGNGWFKPSQGRHGWDWLAARFDANHDGRITREEFTGSPEWFDRLDRDRDGAITQSDLDWSDKSPYWGQLRQAAQLIRRGDRDRDQKLSKAEWDALFKDLARDKGHVDADDLRAALFPPEPPRQPGPPPDMPSRVVLLRGLFNSELGSPLEGPRLGQVAPDFTLTTHDGKKTVTLSDYRGRKPVVLIFGSFT
jgi:hypothetical protein